MGAGGCGGLAADPRKKPGGMAMIPQPLQTGIRQRHGVILVALPVAHMHEVAWAVDISDLEMGAFLQPEAYRVPRQV